MEICLQPMSEEQRDIYQLMKTNENVVVDACAGSGKSTTILSISKYIPNKKFIQLTYNSMLCSEIRQKRDNLSLDNLSVYTYHSLAVKYYKPDGYTDTSLRHILKKKMQPMTKIPLFDVLVIDEAQDMTFLYFKLVAKFCMDMGHKIQMLIMGDYMQGLYEFKGADTRFLTCASKIWKNFSSLKTNVFHSCTLKISYRITEQMSNFVNEVMLGEKRLNAQRTGNSVVYLRRSSYNTEKYVIHHIKKLLHGGDKPSDFFILGASVKGEHSSIRKMENALVENDIPCHVPLFENDKMDERVIEGKVVFSTFHSVKGRQRKYVFVIGFDNSYFDFYAKNVSSSECPNTLYVACTRATHGLFLIEKDEPNQMNRPLKFLKMNHHEMKKQKYIEFHGIPQTLFYKKKNVDVKKKFHRVTPTEIIKFVSESVLEEITPILENIFTKECFPQNEIEIPNIIQTEKGFYEDVSDLNGIAIPNMYFDKLCECTSWNDFFESDHLLSKNENNILYEMIHREQCSSFLRKYIQSINTSCETIADYLKLTNIYIALKEKLYFKLKQIENEYNWMKENDLILCFQRLHNVVGKECFTENKIQVEIEKNIIHFDDENAHEKINAFLRENGFDTPFHFSARVDAVTSESVWELKCCNNIINDHLLQVVIYAWIWKMTTDENKIFKIFNVKTNEILHLNATMEQLNFIVISILKSKCGKQEIKKNEDFIRECDDFFEKMGQQQVN